MITGDFNTKPGTAAIEKMDGSLLRLESYWSLFQEGDDGAGGEALPNRWAALVACTGVEGPGGVTSAGAREFAAFTGM